MRVRRSYWAGLCSALFSAAMLLTLSSTRAMAQAAVGAQAVIIKTDGTIVLSNYGYEPPASYDEGIPFGTVILLFNGNGGVLALDSSNNITGPTGNFVIRSANEFLRRGLHVMIPDAALAFPSGMTSNDRLGAVHAAQLQVYINAAAARWKLPVWVVGTGGGGAFSAINVGGFAPALTGYAGIVIGSPATAGLGGGVQTLFDTYKARVTAPTWIGWHAADTCTSTPPAGSAALFAAIPATDKVSATFTGGHAVAADPCSGLAEASFAGIEATVVTSMVNFIKARSGLVAIPNQAAPAPKPTPLPAPAPMASKADAKR